MQDPDPITECSKLNMHGAVYELEHLANFQLEGFCTELDLARSCGPARSTIGIPWSIPYMYSIAPSSTPFGFEDSCSRLQSPSDSGP